MKLSGLLVLGAVGLGCQRGATTSSATPGHERGACRPDKSCDPGLLCLSDLCVRPPPADCQAVADQLVSLDLGNYAEPEDRAPVVARYKAACDAARVSKEEQQCLDRARDKWSAGQCVPRMFPELASSSTADCAAVVARTKAMMTKQAAYLNDPKLQAWFDRTMAVMQESCEQDLWPDSLKHCMLASDDAAAAAQRCNQQMPRALQDKLQARMTKAMQELPPR